MKRSLRALALVGAIAALLAVCLLSVAVGSREVPLGDVVQALLDPDRHDLASEAVRLRVPRTVLGLLVGAALALSGVLMQGLTSNPLADPGLLGISSGAAFAIVLGMVFLNIDSPAQFIWFALVGSVATGVIVWLIGTRNGRIGDPLRLALAGAIIASVLSSAIQGLLLPRAQTLSQFRYWMAGGLDGARFEQMLPVLPFFAVGMIIALSSGRTLNTLALGDDLAAGLGGSVNRSRAIVATGALVLAAASTALAGPIGFVGLVVPHAVRAVVGVDHNRVLGWSLVAGPLLLVGSDVLGRVITRPADVQVGIVTAVIGAPVFIALVLRQRRAGGRHDH